MAGPAPSRKLAYLRREVAELVPEGEEGIADGVAAVFVAPAALRRRRDMLVPVTVGVSVPAGLAGSAASFHVSPSLPPHDCSVGFDPSSHQVKVPVSSSSLMLLMLISRELSCCVTTLRAATLQTAEAGSLNGRKLQRCDDADTSIVCSSAETPCLACRRRARERKGGRLTPRSSGVFSDDETPGLFWLTSNRDTRPSLWLCCFAFSSGPLFRR